MPSPFRVKPDFQELRDAIRMPSQEPPCPRGSWLNLGFPGDAVHRQLDLPIQSLHPSLDGLRVVHLTDLHMRGRWHRSYDRLLADIQNRSPDLILFTGDFVECKYDHRAALPYLQRFIKGLSAKLGIYAILGNHDPDIVRYYVAEQGIPILTHRRVLVPVGEAQVELVGLPGIARADLDRNFIRSVPPPTPGIPRIVLSHYPDYLTAARNLQMDLFLAGHTHGGQACFPNHKPLITHDSLPKALSKGVHRIGRTWFAVSNGLGFSGLMLRVFCPPEWTEFTLRSATAESRSG
jgi:hypothetical protein